MYLDALEQLERRRRRHGKRPVRSRYRPVANAHRPAEDAIDAQALEAPDRADDVENRVDGAHLVQVYALGRDTVYLALGRRDREERLVCALAHGHRNVGARYQVANLVNAARVR